MGSWFSNLHIRNTDNITADRVMDELQRYLESQGYLCASAEDADAAVAVLAGEKWTTVCSDILNFEDPKVFAQLAEPMSGELQTDVLGIACFDSDYLYLNLINRAEKVDAWLGIGSAAGLGIRRRTGIKAWTGKVRDHGLFSACAKEQYVCAEEFLHAAADCLELPPERGCLVFEYLADFDPEGKARMLHFKLPEDHKPRELPKLKLFWSSMDPCKIGEASLVDAVNVGGESRGLSVYFIGPYVEHEEITFLDFSVSCGRDDRPRKNSQELTKVQLADGQWAYHYHDPGFRIPPKVDERLPIGKQMRMNLEREIIVRFIPRGDRRKCLDIAVVLVPDKNFEGQVGWNVWQDFGSKEAYIDQYNKGWAVHRSFAPPGTLPPVLRREDYD